jgi:hypothetical protein
MGELVDWLHSLGYEFMCSVPPDSAKLGDIQVLRDEADSIPAFDAEKERPVVLVANEETGMVDRYDYNPVDDMRKFLARGYVLLTHKDVLYEGVIHHPWQLKHKADVPTSQVLVKVNDEYQVYEYMPPVRRHGTQGFAQVL